MKKKVVILIILLVTIFTVQAVNSTKISSDSNAGKIERSQSSDSIFDEKITFSWSYNSDAQGMPYGLYTPSNADKLKSVPVIVWLHGSGEIGSSSGALYASGLPATINQWKLEGFSAYILCPHLRAGGWANTSTLSKVKTVIDNFISEYNVDTKNMVIVGHSAGGTGALYTAYNLPGYFSRGAALSPYNPGYDLSQLTIPMLSYVGTSDDSASASFVNSYFKPAFGEENCLKVTGGHGQVPSAAFTDDSGEKIKRCKRRKWSF